MNTHSETDTLRSLAERKGLLIGTASGADTFQTDAAYADIMAREFNCIVAENSMKLETIQAVRGEFDFSQTAAMMDFAARHDMQVRAVPLVWHEALPDWAHGKTF
ncbi:MAG: endo-1,4-beta-xylanase, partial [Verrucomicrobia bacterium]|nr:endo-1,4-beta-xylanase [Verrucomicrobiota bacterium]